MAGASESSHQRAPGKVAQPPDRLRVVLIEDNPADAVLLQESLAGAGARIDVEWHKELDAGLEAIAQRAPDAVLLDLNLDASRGLPTFERVHEQAPTLPIVVMSGLDDEKTAAAAVRSGAEDYVVKGTADGATILRTLRYAVERKRANKELAETRERLANLVAHLEDVTFTFDVAQARFLQVSASSKTVLGLAPDALLAYPELFSAVAADEDRDRHGRAWGEALAGQASNLEFRLKDAQGTQRWVLAKYQPGLDASGRTHRVYGILSDVSERRAAEEARAMTFRQKLEIEKLGQVSEAKTSS